MANTVLIDEVQFEEQPCTACACKLDLLNAIPRKSHYEKGKDKLTVGNNVVQPDGDLGKPVWHSVGENRFEQRLTLGTRPNSALSRVNLNTDGQQSQTSTEPQTACGHGDFRSWLAEALRSERVSVEAMLEKQHEAMVLEITRIFERPESDVVVPAVVHGDAPLEDSTGPVLGPTLSFDMMDRKTTYKNRRSEAPVVASEVATHAQRLDERLQQQHSKARTSTTDALRQYFGANGSSLVQKVAVIIEVFFAAVITINVLIMAMECQYKGFDIGYSIRYRDYRPAEETWPGGSAFFRYAEWVIGSLYTLEVLLMICFLRGRFFRSWWHIFDAVVVVFWFIYQFDGIAVLLDPSLLRVARVMRLLRLLRVLRFVAALDALHLILRSVLSSVVILLWSLLLLLFVIVVTALTVRQLVESFMEDDAQSHQERLEVFEQWGSFSRATETMFEVTLGNWGPPCRLLQDKVISSVFIQQTFKVVAVDEQSMIAEKKKAGENYLKQLDNLFHVIDVTGDGFLSQEELSICLNDKTVKAWFQALEIDVSEASTLFDLIDDGDGVISRTEFIEGVKGLRGVAKAMDIKSIMKQMNRIVTTVSPKVNPKRERGPTERHASRSAIIT
eukprot:TRINITY_DN24073_c0_g1_i2.p1 TRINITY_DN24073_c0_g1~~TRINITY_DN24073_c0_g1_i2.p1  ORF type:complete len:644 (-),score=91.17 TRINITY_DN24073_c0_g1_i2:87-1931(-)